MKNVACASQRFQATVVLCASFMTLFFNTSLDYSLGVFHVAILETYNSDPTLTVWIGSVFFCMFGLGGPIASFIINVFDCRTCVFISGLLGLVGFSLNIFVYDVRWLFVTYAVLAGLGTSLAHTGALVVIGYHFQDNMSMACGIAVCGMAAGLFAHPPLVQYLIDVYGLQNTFLVVGGIAFNACVCGMIMTPTKFERTRRARISSGHSKGKTFFLALCGNCSGYSTVIKNSSFVCFLLSGLCFGMGISAQYLYLPDFLQKRGITAQAASFSVSVSGIGGVVSRLLTGVAAQDPRIGSGLLFAALNGVMGIVSFLLDVFTSSAILACTYGFLIGLYTGGSWALFNPVTTEIIGLEHMATGYGSLMFFVGIGCLSGPPLANIVYGLFDEYYGVYIFSGGMFLSCALFCFLSTALRRAPQLNESKPVTEAIGLMEPNQDTERENQSCFSENEVKERKIQQRVREESHESVQLASNRYLTEGYSDDIAVTH